MKQVASLQYGVIFKKAFSQPDIFTAFVEAVLGIHIEIDKVETEKSFRPPIGAVDSRFDLYAQDDKNRIIVDIQHRQTESHYDRFLHYHCAAILEQIPRGKISYHPRHTVFTIVVLTSNDKHNKDVLTIDFDPKDLQGNGINEIRHKIIYLCPKCVNENTPIAYKEWMEAIADTLDEQVDENHYHNVIIQKIFDSIEEDGLTPKDRYDMIEEAEDKEFIATERKKAVAEATAAAAEATAAAAKAAVEAVAEAALKGALKEKQAFAKGMLAKNFDLTMIAELTGLTLAQIEEVRVELEKENLKKPEES